MTKEKVYMAGRLGIDAADNTIIKRSRICLYAEIIRSAGYSIYIPPGLDFLEGFRGYDDYYNNNLEWLKASDILYVIPDSLYLRCVKKEIEYAKKHDIPIRYDMFWLDT